MIKDQYGVPWEKEVVIPENTGSMIGRDVTKWRVKLKPSWHRQIIREKDGHDYLRTFEIPKGEEPVMGRDYEQRIRMGPVNTVGLEVLEIGETFWEGMKNIGKYFKEKFSPKSEKSYVSFVSGYGR